MTKIRRRKPTLDETACVTINDAATIFNMGSKRFRRIFFETNLCDNIPHVETNVTGGMALSLRHVVEAAFPGMESVSQAHIVYEFLKSKDARRKAAYAKRVASMKRRENAK